MPLTAAGAKKIRVGAPSRMVLFAGTANQEDLGASFGGATLVYNPTNFLVEADQSPLPLAAYKVKEEVMFSVSVLQSQADLVLAAWGYAPSTMVTTAGGTFAAMAAPTVVFTGTAGTTPTAYEIVPYGPAGDSLPSTLTTVATGPITLGSTNFFTVSWVADLRASGYKVIRTLGGAAQGLIADVPAGCTSIIDTGLAATAYTPAGTASAAPNANTAYVGGQFNIPNGTFDWVTPKQDNTSNNWLGHLANVVSAKQVSANYSKEKATEWAKLELVGMADLTQPIGQQAGWIREQF